MDDQEKPKSKRKPSTSFLTPEESSSFFYSTRAPLEAVLHALSQLELTKDDLRHTMTVTPVSLGYTFRYDIITPGVIKPKLSAYAEGQILQNEHQVTEVRGTIHVAISNQEILVITAMSLLPIPFLLLLPIALFNVMTQRSDARLIKRNLDETMAGLSGKTADE